MLRSVRYIYLSLKNSVSRQNTEHTHSILPQRPNEASTLYQTYGKNLSLSYSQNNDHMDANYATITITRININVI